MMVIDASVWVSVLVRDDVHHDDSHTWLEHQVRAGVSTVAPPLVVAEVAGVLARRTGQPAAGQRAVARLQDTIEVEFVPLDLGRAAAASRFAADLRIRGADAVYVAVADEFGVPLVTWDHQQRERASARVTVLTPTSTP